MTDIFLTEKNVPPESIKAMVRNIFQISIPAIVGMLSAFMVEVINVSFVGYLGDSAIVAGCGLGNMYINIICMATVIGLNNTLSTLVP